MKIRRISTRLALTLALAAVAPLVAFGLWSLVTLQGGTRETIVQGNRNVAERAAEEIRRYVFANAAILKALAADLQSTGLETWQQDRILKNYVLQFREFREITLFDAGGTLVATSRIGAPRVFPPTEKQPDVNGVAMSPLRLDDDLLPTSLFSIHLSHLGRASGWLVGEFSLEEMWRMVDAIRLGQRGFALVVGLDGALVAHGTDRKALVAQAANLKDHPLLAEGDLRSGEYIDSANVHQLGVAARVGTLGWTVIVEQPTEEAYAIAGRLRQQLMLAAGTALLLMVGAGLVFGRRFIAPIFALQRGTQALASGHLETRVDIKSEDEFGALGRSFNTMADRLVELQEDVKRKERQATFGRVVAGLFHDLNHPIQNIGNNARLILRSDLDEESRQTSRRSIERELVMLKRFMDDMLNVAKPQPLEHIPLDLNRSAADVVEAIQAEANKVQVAVVGEFASEPLTVDGDSFALGRVYRNLVTNAIQATPPGGRVRQHPAGRKLRRSGRRRYRVRHTAGSIAGDLRRFHDHETTRVGPRIGDIEAHCRAARGHDTGQEHPGRGNHVHAQISVPRPQRTCPALTRGLMFRTLIKTTTLAIDDRSYAVRYFEARTPRGGRRYSAEIVLNGMDRFILDDDSLSSLETRTTRVVPATLESRTLMKTA